MKHLKTGIAMIMLTIGLSTQSQAQKEETTNKTKYSIEIDPATFVFNGYGIHFRLQPKGTKHLLLGLGTYAMDMPDLLVDLNKNNKNEGWKIRINQGYSIFVEHHLKEVNRKWFVGTQIGIQEYKIGNENISENERFTNILAMGYFGYTIKPFKNNFYIKPWAGIGYTSRITGDNSLGTSEYDIAPITMFATLHLGYTF